MASSILHTIYMYIYILWNVSSNDVNYYSTINIYNLYNLTIHLTKSNAFFYWFHTILELFKISKIRSSIKSVNYSYIFWNCLFCLKLEIWWLNSHLSLIGSIWIGLIWINTNLNRAVKALTRKRIGLWNEAQAVVAYFENKFKVRAYFKRTIMEIDRFMIWLVNKKFLYILENLQSIIEKICTSIDSNNKINI